jgi:hypothetical protein
MIKDLLGILSMFVLVALIIAVALLAGLYAAQIIPALMDALQGLGML